MKTVTVAEAKARLSELLNRIEHGDEIVVTRRGRPIARLTPIRGGKKQPIVGLSAFREQIARANVAATEALLQLRKESR